MKKLISLFIIFYGLGASVASAQFRAKKSPNTRTQGFAKYSTFDFGGGSSSYYGDLNPYQEFMKSAVRMPRWNVSASWTRHLSPKFDLRLGASYIRIAGDDIKFMKDTTRVAFFLRNAHFRNDLKEASLVGIWKMLPDGEGINFKKRAWLVPYVFGGIAVFSHSPQARTPLADGNEWVALNTLRTEGQGLAGYDTKPYSSIQLAIPFGGGVRYRLSQRLDISAEVSFRYTFTDYLDDVSDKLADPLDLESQIGLLSRQMANRSLEQLGAYSGIDRKARFQEILVNYFNVSPNSVRYNQPFDFLLEGFSQKGDFRGNPNRLDAYLLTVVKIHYVLAPKVKCPNGE